MVFSTQQAIEIAGIKDGILILKDGSYRIVLQVSATNFALKSEAEQNSIVFQYQSFLNSLHFPVQIVIRSKRLDLSPYLAKVKELTKNQSNELIAAQATDYVDFIEKLITIANIMKKTFYAVVSFNPVTMPKTSVLDKFFGKSQTFDHVKISDVEYKEHTAKLRERASVLASGLGSMGLHCFQLTTEQLIELFYQIYNPDEASKERLTDPASVSSAVILTKDEAGEKPEEGGKINPNTGMIDNSNVVEEKQKQEAIIKKQQSDKDTEREIKSNRPDESEKEPQKVTTNTTAEQQQPLAQPAENESMATQINSVGQADNQTVPAVGNDQPGSNNQAQA